MTYAGALATFLAGFTALSEAEALDFVNAGILVITTLITLYGRTRKGDVDWTGMKKDSADTNPQ